MKRKFYFYLAAVATMSLTLAACSKDDTTTNTGVKFGDKAYAKVALKMAGGTRATGLAGYLAGTADESTITNLTIMLTDENKNVVGIGTYNTFAYSATDSDVEHSYEDLIIPIMMTPGNATPEKLYAFVNMDAEFSAEKDILDAETGKLNFNICEKGKFMMTNSGYYGTDWVVGVELPADALQDTEAAAEKADAVEINVERLAARVQVAQAANAPAETKAIFKSVDNQEYTIEFKAKKWGVTGIANSMYLFKQAYKDAETLPSTYSWTWADGTNRSFWAKGVYYNNSYSDYTTDAANNGMLTYLSASQLIATTAENAYAMSESFTAANAVYVPEHTFGTAAQIGLDEEDPDLVGKFAPKFTGTDVIVVGKYEISGASDAATRFKGDGDNEFDFYLSLKAKDTQANQYVYTIYSKNDLIDRLFEVCNIKVAKSSGAEQPDAITASDYFGLEKGEAGYKLTYKGEGATALYKYNDTSKVYDTLLAQEDLTATVNAAHYYNGWAYFMAPIEHNLSDTNFNESTVGSYGVVRNHAYQLTINKYEGLGAPLDESKIGPDPENHPENNPQPEPPIIPDPTEQKESYINATLNVLGWHLVGQDVNF